MGETIDFKELKLLNVIGESTVTKSITFQGEYKGQTAVIRLDKEPFDANLTRQTINHQDLDAERNLANDIYSRYELKPPRTGMNNLKATVVVPADDTVLAKYSRSETVFFSETSSIYETIVEPFIVNLLKNDANCNQWIYNILDGVAETDGVLHNDLNMESGFSLLPSLRSSGDEKEIHILAICHRRDIRSLRDLNRTHLPLLENILNSGTDVIRKKYSHLSGQIRPFIHYQPTFYHFHVHFEIVDPGEYKSSDRDNLLTTVINNIKLIDDYYRRSTLTYPISKKSALYQTLAVE